MTTPISSIPTSRVSDLFVRNQLLRQIQANQLDIFNLQTQLSTGHSFQLPSENTQASLRVTALQSLLQRKDQIRTNIQSSQSYLNITDSALSNVSDMLSQARALGVASVGVTATDEERQATVQQIQQIMLQLMNIGNQGYNNRYLFAGSQTGSVPFQSLGNGMVEYSGNEQRISSYADLNMLVDSNLNGNEVFGAISSEIQGSVTITPILTYNTALADLRGGRGISKGSIVVSDGTNTSTIDISEAKTIGDLARIIHDHPPQGRQVYVDVTADRLIVQLDSAGGGNLCIRDVGGGAAAKELGISCPNGVGTNPVTGAALNPLLTNTTALDNILGAYANTFIHSTGNDNEIRLQADFMGAATTAGVALNGVTVSLVNDPTVTAGHEKVVYDPVACTITVGIEAGASRAYQVVNAINYAHDSGDLPFTAEVDPSDDVNHGYGLVEDGASAVTRDGAGEA
ncbi:MAG: flagellar hook-associated protein FlgL, partial [Thermoguttaceae bacterium]